MLKIYNNPTEVTEEDKPFFDKHYKQRADGKWEPQIEGINSIGGVLTKNNELADEINNKLKPRLRELEGKEVLTDGKIAVDKKEFDAMKTEFDSYKALGNLNEIKPKVEGFDTISTERAQEKRDALIADALGYAGIKDVATAKALKPTDKFNIEVETVDGKNKFFDVVKVGDKTEKKEFNADYLGTIDGYKSLLPSLMGEAEGVKYPVQTIIKDGKPLPAVEAALQNKYAGTIAGLKKS